MNPFNIRKNKNCNHLINFRLLKSFTEYGVPFLDHECYDCGYVFKGRVYVDPKKWESKLIGVENGFVLIDKVP